MDYAILDFIQEHIACGFLDILVPLITKLCDGGLLPIVIGLVLLFFKKYRKYGILILLSLIVGSLLCNVWLKPWIARPRPFVGMENIQLLIPEPGEFSFPSGHTTSAFAFAFAVSQINKRTAIAGYVFAVLIGFSRLYLYVHFPSDVLVGAIVGTVAGLIAFFVYRLVSVKWQVLGRIAP